MSENKALRWVKSENRLPTKFGNYVCIVRVEDDGVNYEPASFVQFDTYKGKWTNPRVCRTAGIVVEWLEEYDLPAPADMPSGPIVGPQIVFLAFDPTTGQELRTPVYIDQEGNPYKDSDPYGVQMNGSRKIFPAKVEIRYSRVTPIKEGASQDPIPEDKLNDFMKWLDDEILESQKFYEYAEDEIQAKYWEGIRDGKIDVKNKAAEFIPLLFEDGRTLATIKKWIEDNSKCPDGSDNTYEIGFAAAAKKVINMYGKAMQLTDKFDKTVADLQSQLSSIKAERDEAREALRIANNNVKGLTNWWEEVKKDRDLYKKESEAYKQTWIEATATLDWKNLENAQLREKAQEYRDALESIKNMVCESPLQELAQTDDIVQTILEKYKKEEQK